MTSTLLNVNRSVLIGVSPLSVNTKLPSKSSSTGMCVRKGRGGGIGPGCCVGFATLVRLASAHVDI